MIRSTSLGRYPELPNLNSVSGKSGAAQRVLGLADEPVGALNFSLANAAVTTLRFRPSELSLITLNSLQHLRQAGAEKLVIYR